MNILTKIGNSLADGVNWPVVFYFILGVAALYVLSACVDLSLPNVVGKLAAEITKIFSRRASRTAIDGGLTFSLIIFTLIVLLSMKMREVPEMLAVFKLGVEDKFQSSILFIFMVCITVITGIISLLITEDPPPAQPKKPGGPRLKRVGKKPPPPPKAVPANSPTSAVPDVPAGH
jgi:hypothetical protein